MGTTFRVRVVASAMLLSPAARQRLAGRIDAELELLEARLSHYRPDSDVSRFNRLSAGEALSVSVETLEVLAAARELSRLSDGAFDVTVAPLVDAWGFGPSGPVAALPSDARIETLRGRVGYDKVLLDLGRRELRKRTPGLTLNLSAIGKGYAVDRVAALLRELDIADYLVEIGGELRAAGRNAAGRPWQVAIESPRSGARRLQRFVVLDGQGLATSGEYRTLRRIGGSRVSHTVDPRSGRPVEHALASVSVIASSCMRADGLATALNVLGPQEGWALAQEHGLAALFVSATSGDDFEERVTPAFRPFLGLP